MNRALPLLLLVAAAGGGLAFFATQTGHRGPRTPTSSENVIDVATRAPVQTPKPTKDTSVQNLAAVASRQQPAWSAGDGPAKVWEIIPMNSKGQILPDATLTATKGTEERTGKGRTRWQSLPSGTWELVIESEGNPVWRREIDLLMGRSTRTAPRLGKELRIEGTVVDTNGVPITRLPVFLLPPGVRHPGHADMKRDTTRPRNPAQAQNGAVTAQLDSHGHFSAKLPKAGAWRISIGPTDVARWTQPKPTVLTYGGPDQVVATIPAKATLRLSFAGAEDERPRQASAYLFDPKLATQVQRGREGRYIDTGMSREDAQKAAKEDAMQKRNRGTNKPENQRRARKGRNGTARTTKEEMIAAVGVADEASGNEQQGRGRASGNVLFDPGWRMLKSIRIDADGNGVFNDMPGGEDLKFLFVRGRERITTGGAYRLVDGRVSIGSLTLPPLDTTPPAGQDARASLRIRMAAETDGAEPREIGVVWGQ